MPIGKAIRAIVETTADLGRKYDAEINCNRRSSPRLMDRRAFALAGQKLTYYAIELTMCELSAAKRLADDVVEGLVLDFEPKTKCKRGCQGPLRYSLPCRRWLYSAVADNVPIPLSLFHPHRLLDGPAVLYENWVMTWDEAQQLAPEPTDRHTGDRFVNRGQDLIREAALAAKFASGASKLAARQEERLVSLAQVPLTMPEPLVEPNLRHFPSSRKRAITGLEAAEEEEADKRRQRRLAAVVVEADRLQDEHEERDEERTAMIAEHWHQSQIQSQLSSLEESPKESSSNPSSEDESSSSSSEADNTKVPDHDIFDEDGEPRRSGRVRRPTRDAASQMS